jgi:hypothetical protein
MMARTQFSQAVCTHLQRTPFKPFTIEMDDGRQYLVKKPEDLNYPIYPGAVAGGTATFSADDLNFEFIDCDAVKRFIDADAVPAS